MNVPRVRQAWLDTVLKSGHLDLDAYLKRGLNEDV